MTNSETTIFVYDGTGKLVAEYSTKTPPPSPTTNYTATDPLGSPRVVTNRQGQIISRRDFMPFGEELAPDSTYRTANLKYGAGDSVRQKFTSYERDNETDLDYAKARYYAKNYGRFTSTDPLLSSGKLTTPQTWNRYSYTINNPLRFIDPNGLCTAPGGLKAGQVGICFEAFIAQPRLGIGNRGHGDDRDFAGNDSSKTARVTVWVIVSTDEKTVNVSRTDQVSPSLIGGEVDPIMTAKTGVTQESPQSLQGTAITDAKLSNINSKVGEKDFGAGVDVTVSIANGTNGGQQLGRDIQSTGAVAAGISPAAGAIITGVGKVAEAVAPAGTIDGNVTLRITGSGQVTGIGGESRGFPSYAAYSYTVGADGNIVTQEIVTRRENKIEDLTKPMTPFPR